MSECKCWEILKELYKERLEWVDTPNDVLCRLYTMIGKEIKQAESVSNNKEVK